MQIFSGLTIIAATGVALVAGHAAEAATSTGNISVSATVAAACTVSSTNMAFSSHARAQHDQAATIRTTCSDTMPYIVALSAGTFVQGNPTASIIGGLSGTTQELTVYGLVSASPTVTSGAIENAVTITFAY